MLEGMSIKEHLRSSLKIRRRDYYHHLSVSALAELEQQFTTKLFALPPFCSPSLIIGCYYAIKEEVPTSHMMTEIWKRGYQVALPHIHKDFTMSFHAYHPGDLLEPTFFKIPQPSLTAPQLEPDVLIVPMLGFSRDGHRIGYGLGHYDRALRTVRSKGQAVAIGFAFDCQEVTERFVEHWDEKLDWIITESATFECPAKDFFK